MALLSLFSRDFAIHNHFWAGPVKPLQIQKIMHIYAFPKNKFNCPTKLVKTLRRKVVLFLAASTCQPWFFIWDFSFWLFVFFAGVTILLSLTVFMNMVQTIMPSTSDSMPLIGFSLLWSSVSLQMDRCHPHIYSYMFGCFEHLPPSPHPHHIQLVFHICPQSVCEVAT